MEESNKIVAKKAEIFDVMVKQTQLQTAIQQLDKTKQKLLEELQEIMSETESNDDK